MALVTNQDSKSITIVFAGCNHVGKSSIFHRIKNGIDKDLPVIHPTIGVDFLRLTLTHNEKSTKAIIWDTAGHERFSPVIVPYFKICTYCILIFDISYRKSFDELRYWKSQCEKEKHNSGQSSPIYFLIANKIDKGIRAIDPEEIADYCELNNIFHYIEMNAVTGEGISELCEKIAEHASSTDISEQSLQIIRLDDPIEKAATSCFMCLLY